MRLTLHFAAAAAALTVATPACAQGIIPQVIGQTIMNMHPHVDTQNERSCMAGRKPKTSLFFEARVNATASLQRYLHLAAGGAPADATAAFTSDAGKREWLRNGNAGTFAAVDDPLARMIAARDFALPAPASFYRAGDGVTALGIWRVPGADAAGAAGYYRILFRREGQDWVVQRLELVEGASEPGPIAQFCHVPGDLDKRATAHKR